MAGLCTLASVKLALFPTGYTDNTDDTLLQSYIDGLTAEVQSYTQRQFISDAAPTDYYFDVSRQAKSLFIPQGIQSVASLGFAKTSQPETGGTYTAVSAANILLRPKVQDRRTGFPADYVMISDLDTVSQFYYGYNTVKLTATCGFATVPAELERTAVAIVVRRFQARKGGQTDSIGAPEFGGGVLRFMSPEEKATIDDYRNPAVG